LLIRNVVKPGDLVIIILESLAEGSCIIMHLVPVRRPIKRECWSGGVSSSDCLQANEPSVTTERGLLFTRCISEKFVA
jgi:hypothetical protein